MTALHRTWIIRKYNNGGMKIDMGEPKWIPKSYGICARGRLTYSQMWKRIWITAPANGKRR